MALRDQPYIPLYVQDVLTDEKLIECSAESHGVYFRLLCILHKQDTYGLLCLKQKHKQNPSKLICFASMLARQMPFKTETIAKALEELTEENVLVIEGDALFQKRMVHDGQISLMRKEVGKKGGSSVTKQYGKSGYLYLMSDGDKLHKIGISVNPKNRLYRLRSSLKLSKLFDIVDTIKVNDMGITEDLAHVHFGNLMDGEWIKDSSNAVLNGFVSFKAKLQANDVANTENETVNEYNTDNESKIEKEGVGEKTDFGKNIFDAEKEVLGNEILFEQILMKTRKEEPYAKEELRKFHLYLVEHEKYPYNRQQVFAGFEKWLLNGKSFIRDSEKRNKVAMTVPGFQKPKGK